MKLGRQGIGVAVERDVERDVMPVQLHRPARRRRGIAEQDDAEGLDPHPLVRLAVDKCAQIVSQHDVPHLGVALRAEQRREKVREGAKLAVVQIAQRDPAGPPAHRAVGPVASLGARQVVMCRPPLRRVQRIQEPGRRACHGFRRAVRQRRAVGPQNGAGARCVGPGGPRIAIPGGCAGGGQRPERKKKNRCQRPFHRNLHRPARPDCPAAYGPAAPVTRLPAPVTAQTALLPRRPSVSRPGFAAPVGESRQWAPPSPIRPPTTDRRKHPA